MSGIRIMVSNIHGGCVIGLSWSCLDGDIVTGDILT